MWWPCVFFILSVHAGVNDVKDDYYYPKTQEEFPVLDDQIKARQVDDDTNMFEITGRYEYETHFVYGPDKLFEFKLEYSENDEQTVNFKLEFDMPNGNSFKFELYTETTYVVNVGINEKEKTILCAGQGTIKIISFKFNFEKKEVSCSSKPKPFENSLKPVDFDIDEGSKIVPLKVSWNVGTAKWVWRFPAKAIPFRKIDKPKTTTIATTKPTTITSTTTPAPIEEDEEDTEETTEKQTAKAGFPVWAYIVIVAAVFIVIAAVIAVVITIRKRRKLSKVEPDEHYPKPDQLASDVQSSKKPTESADNQIVSAKSILTVTKTNSKSKSAPAPPSQTKPANAPAPTPAPPSAPEAAKAGAKKPVNEKTAEISLEGKSDFKPAQSPGQNIDKLAKEMKNNQKSQRTDEIFI